MTFRLIFHYIIWSIRLGIPAWYYFQINAEWYNKKKGFYSKIDMDARIPKKWRLEQYYFDKNNPPSAFPVFLKPEWGQNSNGIIRIDNEQEFLNFNPASSKIPYILQYAAHEKKEYEVFYILDAEDKTRLSTLNIAQSINGSDERYPVNGINNKNTLYQDITQEFSVKELDILHVYLRELPSFRIARVGLRANSKEDLLLGLFHIIEINLFAPFPIHLLDNSVAKKTKYKFIKDNMKHLVKVSNTTPKEHFNRFVFFKKIIKHYQSKSE
ncbi:hypothetical protein [Bathymodiolus septemdierum thioautotrophic gill symbiont]|uniref:ATP-grasp domain-containing protein n=1 Tax=endosymbiont of Bathymodiolus septemdierum str. Myojin knoll TaxID=1303921 RepID=A0A0P0URL6_9GAMM|nr:hypothetical protein [Bathymodiolus septemdierum thioautotrophic gill symbiont]BAS67480.1 conserved hypothetical protein [endosymbiont of Bathymodiolus septemdierum str. Myojin knoll]